MELLSAHGRALSYIAHHPGCGIKDMSEGMCLTKRTIWGLIGSLKGARLIRIYKDGRNHYYRVSDEGLADLLKDLGRFA